MRSVFYVSLLLFALWRVIQPGSVEHVFDGVPPSPAMGVEVAHRNANFTGFTTRSTPTPDDGLAAPDDEHADDDVLLVLDPVNVSTSPVRWCRPIIERSVSSRVFPSRLDRPPRA